MVFAIAHFTVGFVIVLVVLSVVPITKYRLTGAYLGGIWALVPDIHHFLDGPLADQVYAIHEDTLSNVFFFHYLLDTPTIRGYNGEFTFLSIALLGLTFLVYDWRFGVGRRSKRVSERSSSSEDIL